MDVRVRRRDGGVPGEGLDITRADALPPTAVVYLGVALLEFLVGAIAVAGMAVWWRTLGPGAQFGIAGRREVELTLGTGNLLRRRSIIRPDLFGGGRRRFRAWTTR